MVKLPSIKVNGIMLRKSISHHVIPNLWEIKPYSEDERKNVQNAIRYGLGDAGIKFRFAGITDTMIVFASQDDEHMALMMFGEHNAH